jgi:hypothetical protein
MDAIIDFLNTIFWGYVLIYGLLAAGLYFTVRLGFPQIVHFNEMFRTVLGSRETDKDGISPFQALTVSLASRVGTGNLAGVAVALYLGGPGAIFWMWMVALVGMATAYSESTLAQLYKTHGPAGLYRGGPAFYIRKGLKMPWLGVGVLGVPDPQLSGWCSTPCRRIRSLARCRALSVCRSWRSALVAGGDRRAGDLRRHQADRRGGRDRGALHGGQLSSAGALRTGSPHRRRSPAFSAQIVGEALGLQRSRWRASSGVSRRR